MALILAELHDPPPEYILFGDLI